MILRQRPKSLRERVLVPFLLTPVLLLSACQSIRVAPEDQPDGEVYAVLLNGGGRPRINFQSHLTHVKGFVELLEGNGIDRDHIVIFSADGSDPGKDLATRETNDLENFWMLTRRAQQVLRPKIDYIDSVVEGYELQPATRVALETWFIDNGPRFSPGDTIFFYVTDHGEINKDDLDDNTIVLWNESLSVTELKELFGYVPEGVRTVMLMSQCFSGSFANLTDADRDICGYFASTAERPAYGCYPENRGVDGVGHSHHFLNGIAGLGSLDRAQDHVLVFDDSPDVPHASSDFFLESLLEEHAGEAPPREVADRYLERAWENRSRWEPDIRLLDRIGQTYGVFSPRSLKELEDQIGILPKVSKQLSTYAARWTEALDSVRQQNIKDFLEAFPDWEAKLAPKKLREIESSERAELATELLAAFAPFTENNTDRFERMKTLRRRADLAAAAAYRMEVRLGVLLRMDYQLTSIAGRAYLEEFGSELDKQRYAALLACEGLPLARPSGKDSPPGWLGGILTRGGPTETDTPEPFPRLDDDQKLVEEVMPAWMGIRYRPPSEEEQEDSARSPGAVTVLTVYPDSAAGKAGLEVGDIILGPPGEPFREPNQVREWTMQREIGEPAPIEVNRDGERVKLTLVPDPYPIEMPKLPGPPKVGAVAPELDVQKYRGKPTVHATKDTLLFFWATWCTPCKFALPTLLEEARKKGLHVIAVTDENAETLDRFFEKFDEPFPKTVATDRYRQSFQAFGVSGTPTFVLIGTDGKVKYYETGYNAKVGLRMP